MQSTTKTQPTKQQQNEKETTTQHTSAPIRKNKNSESRLDSTQLLVGLELPPRNIPEQSGRFIHELDVGYDSKARTEATKENANKKL